QHVRIDFLRAGMHRDPALKCAVRAPGGDAFEELAGLAAPGEMINGRDDIGLLAAGGDKPANESATGALAGALDMGFTAQSAAAEQQRETLEPRPGAEIGAEYGQMHRVFGLVDQCRTVEHGSGAKPHREQVVAPIAAAAG